MKFLFCPSCGGISTINKQSNGIKQCSRCKFIGEPKEGTAEEANALVKRIKAGFAAQNTTASDGKADASSMNAIKDSALKENSDKKKIDIIVDERLKALKGKKDGNSEFL
jgi:hypothetical protein